MENPIVSFKNERIEEIVVDWLDVDIRYVYIYLGVMLSKLGFKSNDNIYIHSYNKTGYLCFSVNNKEEYRIRIGKTDKDGLPVMYFEKDAVELGYNCILDEHNSFEVELVPFKYSGLKEDVIYTNEVSDKYVDYEIDDGDNRLELRISKVGNLGVNNQEELVDYLTKIKFPVSIFDVYKKIAEISLGDNISKYSVIDLRIQRYNGLDGYDLTDLMLMEDGKLVTLLYSKDGKQVCCGPDGDWSYDTDKVEVRFSTTMINGVINFNSRVKPKEDMGMYSLIFASSEVDNARDEVGMVKKLVREIVFKR